jgi:hypothetical protein
MIGIRIKEQLLTLYPSTVMNITLNSTAYLGDDNDVIPGSYSLPVTVPLDDHNNPILNYPGRIDNFNKFLKDEPCEIVFDGIRMFSGKASVKPAGKKDAKLSIIINDIGDFKLKKLNELDLGGTRVIGTSETHSRDHAKLTALNPLDYDYVFFPIYNELYRGEQTITVDTTSINIAAHLISVEYSDTNLIYTVGHIIRLTKVGEAWSHNGGTTGSSLDFSPTSLYSWFYQNRYIAPGAGVFFTGNENLAAMPFVKLEYLLTRIFNEFGITLINNFQTDDELKLLCLYNNYSIYTAERVWGTEIDLRNHVSDSPSGEFLKKLLRHFCLNLDITDGGRVAEITPCKELVLRPEKHDWSAKANPDYEIDEDGAFPVTLGYESDPNDILFVGDTGQVYQGYQGEVEKLSDIDESSPAGVYYVYSLNHFYFKSDLLGGFVVPLTSAHISYKSGLDGQSFLSKLSYVGWMFTDTPIPNLRPAVKTEGTIPLLNQVNKFSDKLIFYRGMQPDGAYEAPYASSHVYDSEENIIGEYSLLWNGPHGMYEQWWKEWFFFLMNKREVSMPLNLTLADIMNFRFSDKIRIDNQNYFVRSLQITLTMRGLAPCKAQLMSTL